MSPAERTAVTQILCWLWAAGWLVIPVFLIALIFANGSGVLLGPIVFLIVIAAGFISLPASIALMVWRRCELCRQPLFPFANPGPLASRGGQHLKSGAKPFLGSVRRGVMLDVVATGKVRCVWCGHTDGDAREQLVVKPK